jgi:hypothetical protein
MVLFKQDFPILRIKFFWSVQSDKTINEFSTEIFLERHDKVMISIVHVFGSVVTHIEHIITYENKLIIQKSSKNKGKNKSQKKIVIFERLGISLLRTLI